MTLFFNILGVAVLQIIGGATAREDSSSSQDADRATGPFMALSFRAKIYSST